MSIDGSTKVLERLEDNLPLLISAFLKEHILEIVRISDNLGLLTVPELKNILKLKNLKTSGKKSELIDRIKSNIPEKELHSICPKTKEKIYKISKKGQSMLNEYYKKRETVFLYIADTCYNLIKAGDIDQAYKKMARYESAQPFQRGLGIDWSHEANHGIKRSECKGINCFLAQEIVLSPELSKFATEIKISIVVIYLFNEEKRLRQYIERKLNLGISNEDFENIRNLYRTAFSLISIKRELVEMEAIDIDKFTITATIDGNTCKKCIALDHKSFRVKDAVIGKNCPPFHEGCRCTIIPHFDDLGH